MVEGILALVATLGAMAATGLLVSRIRNDRQPYLIAWALTLVGLALALAAMTAGFITGYSPLLFRIMEIGAALLAPVWLALGMIDLIARYIQVRFAAWLFAISYSVVAVVILFLDPLRSKLTKKLPDPGVVYDALPKLLIDAAHTVAVLALVGCTAVTAIRANKRDQEAQELLMPIALVAGAGVLVVSGSRGFLPGALAVLALGGTAGLVWYGALRTIPVYDDEQAYDEGYEDQVGYDQEPYSREPTGYEEPVYAAPQPMQQPPPPPVPVPPPPPPPPPVQPPVAAEPPPIRFEMPPQAQPAPPPPAATGVRFPSPETTMAANMPTGPTGGYRTAQVPCGQITVFTLIEGREALFDRLADEVIRAARALEPDTLIFASHEVQNAPTQRIVYQLFRDQTAFAEHQRQPHVQRFAAEARPHVMATNVIELKLSTAKVLPLPTLTPQEFQ